MKKVLLAVVSAVLLLSMAACGGDVASNSSEPISSIQNSNMKFELTHNASGLPVYNILDFSNNGYQTNGSKYVDWFQVTNQQIATDLNKRLKTKGYTEISPLKDSDSLYSNNDDTWVVSFDNIKGTDKSLVYEVTLDLFAKDNNVAALKGFYAESLIDMFTPEQGNVITECLGLYQNKENRDANSVIVICGNTKYTLKGEVGLSDKLIISPINLDYEEDPYSQISPIKPQ